MSWSQTESLHTLPEERRKVHSSQAVPKDVDDALRYHEGDDDDDDEMSGFGQSLYTTLMDWTRDHQKGQAPQKLG